MVDGGVGRMLRVEWSYIIGPRTGVLMISGPVRRTGPDGYTSLYYMVGKMEQNRTRKNVVLIIVEIY